MAGLVNGSYHGNKAFAISKMDRSKMHTKNEGKLQIFISNFAHFSHALALNLFICSIEHFLVQQRFLVISTTGYTY